MTRISRKQSRILILAMFATLIAYLIYMSLFTTIQTPNLTSISDGWITDEGDELTISDREDPQVGKTYVITHTLPEYGGPDMAIMFLSDNIYWRVSVDGEVIQELTADTSETGKTVGDRWNIVELPDDASGKQVTIEMAIIYPVASKLISNVYIEPAITCYAELMRMYLFPWAISIVVMVLSFVCIAANELLYRKSTHDTTLSFLGLFTATISLWSIMQNPISGRIVGYSYILIAATYITFCLSCGLLLEYYMRCQKMRNAVVINVICKFFYFLAFALLFGDMSGLWPFANSVQFVRLCMVVLIIYIVIDSVYRVTRSKRLYTGDTIMLTGNIILAITGVIDAYECYGSGTSDYAAYTRFGLLIYIFFIGIEQFIQLNIYHQKVEETNTIERLAYQDALTGVGNRMAFKQRIEILPLQRDIGFVHFDINNLKVTNDMYGHLEGDELIKSAASCINDAFKSIGRCYRFGGDEFTVIVEKFREKEVVKAIDRLQSNIAVINLGDRLQSDMGIAWGYASYNPKTDKDLMQTLDRADAYMYVQKKKMKSSTEE